MSSDVMSNPERQIARCQSEQPDIYDAHYDAVEQLKAVHARATLTRQPRAKPLPERFEGRNA